MTEKGNRLLAQLLENPDRFKDRGQSYELLQEVFAGHPIADIRDLLTHEDVLVRHAGVFVASEVGPPVVALAPQLIPLLSSEDFYVRYNAIESVAVAAFHGAQDAFLHVLLLLTDDDPLIRQLVMRLAWRGPIDLLIRARARLDERETAIPHQQEHRAGLDLMPSGADAITIKRALLDESALLCRYAAIAAMRNDDEAIIGGYDGDNADVSALFAER